MSKKGKMRCKPVNLWDMSYKIRTVLEIMHLKYLFGYLVLFLLFSCGENTNTKLDIEITDSLFINDSTDYNTKQLYKPYPIDSYLIYNSANIRLYYIYPRNYTDIVTYVYAYYNKDGQKKFKVSKLHKFQKFLEIQKSFLDSLYFNRRITHIDKRAILTNIYCTWEINGQYEDFDEMQKPLFKLKNLYIATDTFSKLKILRKLNVNFWNAQLEVANYNFQSNLDNNNCAILLHLKLGLLKCNELCGLYEEFDRRQKLVKEKFTALHVDSNNIAVIMVPEMQLYYVNLTKLSKEDLIVYDESHDSLQTNILRLKMSYYIK